MSAYTIGVLAGDGIGPEITSAAMTVLKAAEKRSGYELFDWLELPVGKAAIERYGQPLPQMTKDALRGCSGWLMGPHDSASYPPVYKAERNPSGELRRSFDLYANIRPSRSLAGVNGLTKEADLVIFRENTEGFYSDRNMFGGAGEWQVTPDIVLSAGVFTRRAAERIADAAFRAARKRRKRVSIVHKANVIKLGFGLFLETCYEVSKQYPDVAVDDFHIDAAAAHLVRHAHRFDVILTTNMFGDILSDLTGELVGGIGLAPGLNAGDEWAMAQAAHGSAPDIAGTGAANPTGLILSATMLLDWLGERHSDRRVEELGRVIDKAVFSALAGETRTPDLGGNASTAQFAEAIVAKLPV
jgi:3-isopropylmalate dehydrogenase